MTSRPEPDVGGVVGGRPDDVVVMRVRVAEGGVVHGVVGQRLTVERHPSVAQHHGPVDELGQRAELVSRGRDGGARRLSSASASARASWLGRSTPAVGSSRKKRSGSPASARAIRTRCCCPPDGWETRSACRPDSPTTSIASRIAARSTQRESGRSKRRRLSRPEATTSQTEAGTPDDAVLRCGTNPTRCQSWNRSRGAPKAAPLRR